MGKILGKKCKFCRRDADYYNDLTDTHYCIICVEYARAEWIQLISDIVDFNDKAKKSDVSE
jgi:hypothetical protein